jgi:serine/threonine protein kinase
MAVTCPRCYATYHQQVRFCGLCGAEIPQVAEHTIETFPDPLIGQVISDRYRLVALIGRGGMGAVYRAEHVAIGKPVALKILHGTLGQRKEVLQRFRREAEAASKLMHIHTVQVFDYGHWRGLTYLVMEYLRGQDLASVIRSEGRLPWTRTTSIIAQVCDSLAEAHAMGIVHRDLKPENILLVPRAGHPDFVKVVDFGLAKIRDDKAALDTTGDGALLGTPFYMAPEQIRGDPVDARTDVYAIGGVLYRCLTGLPPFEAPTPFAVLTKHLSEVLVLPSLRAPDAGIPPGLDAIVAKAMAKDPADRFRGAEELRTALNEMMASLVTPAATPSSLSPTSPPALATATPSLVPFAVASAPPPSISRPGMPVVTFTAPAVPSAPDLSRDEFDRYLRGLRWRRRLVWSVLLLLAVGGAVAGVVVPRVLEAPPGPVTVEQEPDNVPTDANHIAFGKAVSGTIGRRLSSTMGDQDWFRVEIRPMRKSVLRVDLSGIPGLDLRADLFDVSGGEPLATADRGGPGAVEAIPGVLADGMVYFVRVSESIAGAAVPSERISDAYRLTVTQLRADEFEGEPDDDVATAIGLPPGAAMTGTLEIETDRDTYCVTGAAATPPQAVVTPPAGLDVALDVGAATVNAGGPGQPESATLGPADPCVVVRVAPDADAAGKAAVGPFETYRIEVR